MRLLLIRHGETVDNVAGNYAGTTDSCLTNHGVIQANRLGKYLAANDCKIASIFSSDLQRAVKTADAIRIALDPSTKQVTQLTLLREQDYGFYEGKSFSERSRDSNKSRKDSYFAAHKNEHDFVDVETKYSMKLRADTFIDQHLLAQLEKTPDDQSVVVVAHGVILNHLWRAFLSRFNAANVIIGVDVEGADRGLELLGRWSNTGFLELEITLADPKSSTNRVWLPSGEKPMVSTEASRTTSDPVTPLDAVPNSIAQSTFPGGPETDGQKFLKNKKLAVNAVNKLEHLKGLKKTRGGIGSLKHDLGQKTMESFFKKRKLE